MRSMRDLRVEARKTAIGLALRGLAGARAETWLPTPANVQGFVVTLHHVRPEAASAFRPNSHLSVTPGFLDRFIAAFRRDGWRFVALDEMFDPGAADSRRIAVTLDDGFRDNLLHAWPVFSRHRVPFTIFVTPGFCDATAEIWWEALEEIVADHDEIAAIGMGPGRLPARTPAQKAEAFHIWLDWLTREADEDLQRAAIRALAVAHDFDLARLARDLVMSWDEVREISRDPLCTIGAHTLTHPALARLDGTRALREMAESADRISAETGARPHAIAFPHGTPAAAGSREAALAEAAGFSASFTTRPGFVRAGMPRHGLPRVSLNGDFQSVPVTRALLTPGLWALRDALLRRGGRGIRPPARPAAASSR